jgi:Ni/Co efflux regulator RcnB
MRKPILFALLAAAAVPATLAPTVASAQSRAEIRHDQRVLEREREELREARRFGTRADVREERRDVRVARRELREDRLDRRYSRYASPYRGWTYSPVRVGYQLRPVFYTQRYYIADPYQYRVRPGGRFQQWIRYGDDLLLVNVRTGRVLQVIHNRYRHW